MQVLGGYGARPQMRRVFFWVVSVVALAACESAQVNAGHAAAARGDWRAAVEHFAAAVKNDPSQPSVWTFLGHAKLSAGDLMGAEEAYRKALSLDAAFVPAQIGLVRGKVQRQDWADALSLLVPLLDAPQPSAEALTLQALAALGRGEPADAALAEAAIGRALTLRPDDAGLRYLRGCVLIATKRYDEAQSVFDQLEQRPADAMWGVWGQARLAAAQSRKADVLLHLRRAQALKGRTADPRRLLQDPAFTFMKEDPDFQAVLKR